MNRDSIIKGNWATREVTIDGKRLDPANSLSVHNHSPDGFAWGYGGSGPCQLALALLLEATDDEAALRDYQGFKDFFICHLPQADFTMEAKNIYSWLERSIVTYDEVH